MTVTAAAPTRLDDDGLIAYVREVVTGPVVHWAPAAVLATLFGAVALAATALPAQRGLDLDALAVAVLCYVLASRVRFEFGPAECG